MIGENNFDYMIDEDVKTPSPMKKAETKRKRRNSSAGK